KRAWNIAKETPAKDPNDALLEAGAERDLWAAWGRIRGDVAARTSSHDYAGALATIGGELRAPIDRYFTDVFVMVDDPSVRANRLAMLRTIADGINAIAHLHLLGG